MAFRSGLAQRVWLAALVVGLASFLAPIAAHADACNMNNNDCLLITNGSGSASGNSTGMDLMSAHLDKIGGVNVSGSLSFMTGSLASGSLQNGGTFNDGGSFTIKGTYGNITNGVIFSGSFSGTVTWAFNGCTAGICNYSLTGPITGTWHVNGMNVASGSVVQIDFTTSGPFKGGSINDASGSTILFGLPPGAVVPEPGMIGLMGTGLVGIGLIVRQKAKRSNQS